MWQAGDEQTDNHQSNEMAISATKGAAEGLSWRCWQEPRGKDLAARVWLEWWEGGWTGMRRCPSGRTSVITGETGQGRTRAWGRGEEAGFHSGARTEVMSRGELGVSRERREGSRTSRLRCWDVLLDRQSGSRETPTVAG